MKRARVCFVILIVGLPCVKGAQLAYAPGWDWLRQLALLLAVAIAIGLTVPRARWVGALLTWQVAIPQPLRASWFDDWRWLRLLLGFMAVLFDFVSAAAALGDSSRRNVGVMAGLALVFLGVLVCLEVSRHQSSPKAGPGPDRAVLWIVAPATLLWAIPLVGALMFGHELDPSLVARLHTPAAAAVGDVGEALSIVVVTGLGEEYLYRGLLLVLAVRGGAQQLGFVFLSLGFGLWHVPDELVHAGSVEHRLLAALGVAVATFAASQFILVPLRLRSRSVAGPGLLHAANNLLLRLW